MLTRASQASETMSADETADLDALQLVCPITAELFEDPVLLVEDGHTYERSAVTAWLEKHDTSPMSGAALATKTLAPNIRARQQADTARGSKPPLDGKRHNEVTNLGPARAAANAAATGGPAEGRETRDTGDDWTRIFREERAESQVPLTSWIFREERARGWQAAAAAA